MKVLNAFKKLFQENIIPNGMPVIIYGKEIFRTTDDVNTLFKIRLELLRKGHSEFRQDGFFLYLDNEAKCIREDIVYKL